MSHYRKIRIFIFRLMLFTGPKTATLFPRYISVRNRGGYHQLFWRFYWLSNDYRK